MLWARTKNGELWETLHSPPVADAPASQVCKLVATNLSGTNLALGYSPRITLYDVRSDGTMWAADYPFVGDAIVSNWHRVGSRSDWVAIWGGSGTTMAFTRDGTLWMWGQDYGQQPVPDFPSRLTLLHAQILGWFGLRPSSISTSAMYPFQKDPRPMMKIASGAQTNSVSPATPGK
jgi:hypothetical protein